MRHTHTNYVIAHTKFANTHTNAIEFLPRLLKQNTNT